MKIGYARVSTTGQDLVTQLKSLRDECCEQVFSEKESGAKSDRPQLAAAIDALRESDVLVVTRLDRLARSMLHLWDIIKDIQVKKAHLLVLNNRDLDTSSPMGRLVISILATVAEMERDLIRARSAEGLRAYLQRGGKVGRKPIPQDLEHKVLFLREKKGLSWNEIASETGLSRASVGRVLKAHKSATPE